MCFLRMPVSKPATMRKPLCVPCVSAREPDTARADLASDPMPARSQQSLDGGGGGGWKGPGDAVIFGEGSFGLGFAQTGEAEYGIHRFPGMVGRLTAGGQAEVSGVIAVNDVIVSIGTVRGTHARTCLIAALRCASRPGPCSHSPQCLCGWWLTSVYPRLE